MQRWAGANRCVSLAETVRLLVLPPVLSFVLVASAALLFAAYFEERRFRLTPVFHQVPSDPGCGVPGHAPPGPAAPPDR